MKRFLAFLWFAMVPFAAQAAAPQILPGDLGDVFHGIEVEDVHTGEQWFAIVDKDSEYTVRQVTISSTPASDPILDQDSSKLSGKKLSAVPEIEHVAYYVRGVELKDGLSIPKVKMRANLNGHAEESNRLPIGVTLAVGSLKLIANGQIVSDQGYAVPRNYKLSVITKGQAEGNVLFSLDALDDAEPSLVWAGDLNADGVPDLLIDTTNHYNLTRPTLFLSHISNGIVTYKKTTERTLTGC